MMPTNSISYLDAGVKVHEGPLAVPRVYAQCELHFFIQHHKDPHSLILWTNTGEGIIHHFIGCQFTYLGIIISQCAVLQQ